MSEWSNRSDGEVEQGAAKGNWGAMDEQSHRQLRRHREQQSENRGVGSSSESYFATVLILTLPFIGIIAVIMGLVNGTRWLAEESPMAPLFPGPAASTPEYLLASSTLLGILPVAMWLAALWLHGTRARILSWILFPLATVMVPVVMFVTQRTAMFRDPSMGAGVVSLVLGPALAAVLIGLMVWQRTGGRGLVTLHNRAQRAGQRGDLARFVELQQRLMRRGLRSLGWEDLRMQEEALILAEGYLLLGHHQRARHLTQIAFDAARSQDPESVQELQNFARELGL